MKNVTHVQSAHRYIKEKQMFHSCNYDRKGSTDSSIVTFNFKGRKLYGKIEEFLLVNNIFVAKIARYKVNKFDLPYSEANNVYKILKEHDLVSRFFKTIVEFNNDECMYIKCHDITNKCIIVQNYMGLEYITEIKYDYEHD